MFITLILAAIGVGGIIRATTSYVFKFPFSYEVRSYYSDDFEDDYSCDEEFEDKDIKIITVNGKRYKADYDKPATDLINGFTLLITSLILYGIHAFILSILKKQETIHTLLDKGYIFVNLLLSSIVSVIALPTTIFQVIDYAIKGIDDLSAYSRSIPGEALSTAVVIVPIWMYFLLKALQVFKKEQAAKAVATQVSEQVS